MNYPSIPIAFQGLDGVICLTALLTYFYIGFIIACRHRGSAAHRRGYLASTLKSNGYIPIRKTSPPLICGAPLV